MPVASRLRRPVLIDHTFDFGDDVTVTFRFDRNKITDAWLREWMRLEEAQDLGAINAVLADLIDSWDVTDDQGGPFPPTADNIGYLFTLADKGSLVRALMTAAVPSRAEGNASDAPSNIPPSDSGLLLETPPNGAVPSLSPQPSASPSTT